MNKGRFELLFTFILLLVSVSIPQSRAELITSHVVINEFEQNPPGDERATGGEFVELFNPTGMSIDIGGWSLTTTHGSVCTYTIPTGTTIGKAPSWYVVSFPGQCIDNNDPDSVVLRDRGGSEVDRTPLEIDTFSDGRDWQRMPDAGASWEFRLATKGSNNAPNPIPELPTPLIISAASIFALFLLNKRQGMGNTTPQDPYKEELNHSHTKQTGSAES